LASVAALLIALTIWTYLGARNSTWRRLLVVLALRLGALLVACLLVLRPAVAQQDDSVVPSKLFILIDVSESMNFKDEVGQQSRWDTARRLLSASPIQAILKKLQAEQKVEIVYYQGAEDLARYDPQGQATGKRTDMGQWLNSLIQKHG